MGRDRQLSNRDMDLCQSSSECFEALLSSFQLPEAFLPLRLQIRPHLLLSLFALLLETSPQQDPCRPLLYVFLSTLAAAQPLACSLLLYLMVCSIAAFVSLLMHYPSPQLSYLSGFQT